MYHPRVREGEQTTFVYDSIAAGKYAEVVEYLRPAAELNPSSRAIQSVLGWCYYALQDFVNAADCYERLTNICPDNISYWQYYAQCMNKSGFTSEAMKIVNSIAAKCDPDTVNMLKAAIRYQEEETRECANLLEKCTSKSATVHRNQGCAFFQDKEYSDALAKFSHALAVGGPRPGLLFSLALTYFQLRDMRQALKYCNDVINAALSSNREFIPPSQVDQETVRVLRNSPALQDSFLVEAYNLKMAIEYQVGNTSAARTSLQSIPTKRYEEDVDMITLHNQAVLLADSSPEESIQMFTHIVSQPTYPKEALSNLIIMYFKEEQHELAADFLAENVEVCFTQLTEDTYSFFEACIIQQMSAEEAYIRFEELILRYQDQLKKLSAQEKSTKKEGATEKIKAAESEYDQILSRFTAVVMSQAFAYWERKNYVQVEKQLKRFHEFLSDQLVWRTNMAHTLFMLENYQESAKFYETITRNQITDLMKVSPILLANLCVSYVMTSRNDEAEDVLRRVEDAEENIRNHPTQESPRASHASSHLCLINLVVGTLYCSKGNFPFGVSRILRSFEPAVAQKLDKDTWSYAKTVLLTLMYKLCQHEVVVPASLLQECAEFLGHCEDAGKKIPIDEPSMDPATSRSVASEARSLKKLFLSCLAK